MLTVITGGSGSGKSELAEKIAMHSGKPRIYIATMKPFGSEADERIKRHRKFRAEKNFETIEKYTDIQNLEIEKGSAVLLECMSNLTANEIFCSGCKSDELYQKILVGVSKIQTCADDFVIVTNEIFSDGIQYDKETTEYIYSLGKINNMLFEIADNVIECVYGIPVVHKGVLL